MEDVAIIDIAHKAGLTLGVFAIDTGRLNEETYEVADALTERYRLKIDWYFPRHEDVELLERTKGLFSFRESTGESPRVLCHPQGGTACPGIERSQRLGYRHAPGAEPDQERTQGNREG